MWKRNKKIDTLWYEQTTVADSPTMEKAINYFTVLMYFENYKRIFFEKEKIIHLNDIERLVS